MTAAQVIETSVANDSLSKDYSHPDNHAKQETITKSLYANKLCTSIIPAEVFNEYFVTYFVTYFVNWYSQSRLPFFKPYT